VHSGIAAVLPAAFALQRRRRWRERFSISGVISRSSITPVPQRSVGALARGWHHPPGDFGSNFVPAPALYDSRSTAGWSGTGAGSRMPASGRSASAVGADSNVNEVIPTLMGRDEAHGHPCGDYVEPYTNAHARELRRAT